MTTLLKDDLIASVKGKTVNPSDVLTTPQVCRLLKITRQTLYNWLNNGKVKPWMMVGGASWLFMRNDIEKLKGTKHERRIGRKSKQRVRS